MGFGLWNFGPNYCLLFTKLSSVILFLSQISDCHVTSCLLFLINSPASTRVITPSTIYAPWCSLSHPLHSHLPATCHICLECQLLFINERIITAVIIGLEGSCMDRKLFPPLWLSLEQRHACVLTQWHWKNSGNCNNLLFFFSLGDNENEVFIKSEQYVCWNISV